MTTARKLSPRPKDTASDVPASQDWSVDVDSDDWLLRVAMEHGIRPSRLHLLPYRDPTAAEALANVERGRMRRRAA